MEVPDTSSPTEEAVEIEQKSVNENGLENDESGAVSVSGEESEETSVQFTDTSSEGQASTTIESENTAKDVTENENANELNTASFSMTSVSSLEKSESNEADSSDENDCADDSSKIQTLVFSSNWSDTLKSPKDVLGFSPSETGSGHGMGKESTKGCYRIHVCF